MKYRILLCGKSKSIIDDIFAHLESEFEAQTTSLRYADFISHLRHFSPDAVVFCLHKEAPNAINSMVAVKEELENRRIPLIIIGNTIECEEFHKATNYMAKLVLKKPIRIVKIGEKLISLLEQAKYQIDSDPVSAEKLITPLEEEQGESLDKQVSQEENTARTETVEQTEEMSEEENTTDQAEETEQTEETGEASQEEEAEEAAGEDKIQEIPQNKKSEDAVQEKKRVLVVDDDPMMLRLIKEQLKDTYTVATAINGDIAIKFLENKKTDLVILDYEMPHENGAEVLKKIRDNEVTSNLPVVFLTGISDREKIQSVLSFKPQGYLLKPIEREKLLQIIASIIE